ncbi:MULTISPECIES: septation protein SepH [unclassified Corynebacterium]|uniref:septation protein SepH n=2 Tax=Corynebacterium TaxID=1716 RepID=UPI00124BD13E|nr:MULTISPECIES: septation protein SepH [unclassified Corynebacterium]
MRELELNAAESNRNSLVFHLDEEQVFLAVSDELRTQLIDALSSSEPTPAAPPAPAPPAEAPEESASTSVDPRLTTPLRMRPREIQERVRAGATIAQLAEENDVTESRIEPYAHPVLLERGRIAEMSKQAHPVRDDGPAKLTLWEVLATAFAARGNNVSDAAWDAYRDPSGQWIITVTWTVGRSTNVAEYSYLNHMTSSPTAVARNQLASELINPEFSQPNRALSSVRDTEEDADYDDPADFADAEEFRGPERSADGEGEDFLQHPPEEQAPKRRRRKAKTPHWEDVLLGVRSNTKRPRS